MNHAHIPGFPNRLPRIERKIYLPKFRDEEGDDAALHLVKFHMHVCRLRVEFLEDCLMKMFMATLEDKARAWYEGLQSGSLCSLKDFHRTFFEHYGKFHSSLPLFQNSCQNCKHFI